ncbi:MAG: helix-turn-helix domain-containing protein [Polyangiaceae bacterium]|nr:helix-turn-helix domain-containing protein [Polyangiaceae bacterium]
MDDHDLAQLVASAVAEAQRPLVAELAELRDALARVAVEPGEVPKPLNRQVNPEAPVHVEDIGAESKGRGRLLRPEDVGMTEREWRNAIHRGELRAAKIGRAYVATEAAFDAFLAARQVVPRPRGPRSRRLDPATAAVDQALSAGHLQTTTPKGKR